MNIKIADINDLENIFELNKLFENNTTMEEMENNFKDNNQEIICIAYIENMAVGFCVGLIMKSICYNSNYMNIEALFVKEEYRKKGIGKELIKFLEKEAILKNIMHFHLNPKNKKVELFYEKLGYNNTGEILMDKTIK